MLELFDATESVADGYRGVEGIIGVVEKEMATPLTYDSEPFVRW